MPVAHRARLLSASAWPLRIGLIGAGTILLYVAAILSTTAPLIRLPSDVLLTVAVSLSGLVLIGSSALSRPPSWLRWLILLVFVLEVVINAAVWLQTSSAYWTGHPLGAYVQTDSAVYTDTAAQLLLRGRNPYRWDYSGAMALYRVSEIDATPTVQGADEGVYPYPALPIWLALPFEALHLPGTFYSSTLAYLVMLILLFVGAPRAIQPLILLPSAVSSMINFPAITFIGSMDIVWATLLIGMVMVWRYPVWRAVCFGLALAFKQSPWLLALFLLIRIVRDTQAGEHRVRKALDFGLISGLTFTAINLLFIIADWSAWLRGVLEPIRDSLVFFSQGGLSGLTQYGFVYLPKTYYLIATVTVLTLLLFIYWRHYRRLQDTFWLLPGIALWFSYRNLVTYWTYWLFPMLAVLTWQASGGRTEARRSTSETARRHRYRLTPTLCAIGGTAVILIGAALIMAAPSPLKISVLTPILVDESGHVSGLDVAVTNGSGSLLSPRFAVQHLQTSGNPVAWPVIGGLTALQPGQSATYHLKLPEDADAFGLNSPAQVVVTDGNDGYIPRGVATIQPDVSLLWPDVIANPAFTYWDSAKTSPIYWTLGSEPVDRGSAAMVQFNGHNALELTMTVKKYADNRVFLETQTLFPSASFTIGVYLDPTLQDSTATVSGIDIDDGQHTLWIALGKKGFSGTVSAQHTISLSAPAGQWAEVTIDLAHLYAQLGWSLAPLTRTVYRGIEGDFRVITLRLFIAADGKRTVPKLIHAYFGAIQQQPADPETFMAETLSDPATYYVRLGDEQIANGNYVLAIDAYRRALDFTPDNPDILDKLKHATDYAQQQDAVHPSG